MQRPGLYSRRSFFSVAENDGLGVYYSLHCCQQAAAPPACYPPHSLERPSILNLPPNHQNDDEFEVVPGTNFVVSRTAHRSNKSDYFIDGRRSNFTEVTELLKGKGIDLDNNRFLILQVSVAKEEEGVHGGSLGSPW